MVVSIEYLHHGVPATKDEHRQMYGVVDWTFVHMFLEAFESGAAQVASATREQFFLARIAKAKLFLRFALQSELFCGSS